MRELRSIIPLRLAFRVPVVAAVTFVAFTAVAATLGCNDNDTTTTVITASGDPTPATGPTVPDPTEGGTTAGDDTSVTTGPDGGTSATTASDSDDSDATASATETSDTMDGDFTCWPEGQPEACGEDGACDAGTCSCAALAAKGADFCGAVQAIAIEAGVTEPYLGFIVDMCTGGEDRCIVCFNLQNYCDLLAGSCDNLYTACGCVGDFYGVP